MAVRRALRFASIGPLVPAGFSAFVGIQTAVTLGSGSDLGTVLRLFYAYLGALCAPLVAVAANGLALVLEARLSAGTHGDAPGIDPSSDQGERDRGSA